MSSGENVDWTFTFLDIELEGCGLGVHFYKRKSYLILIYKYSLFIFIFNYFQSTNSYVFNFYIFYVKKQALMMFFTSHFQNFHLPKLLITWSNFHMHLLFNEVKCVTVHRVMHLLEILRLLVSGRHTISFICATRL